jgi:predicted small secreted protein
MKTNKSLKSAIALALVTLSLVLSACNPGDTMTKSNPVYDNTPHVSCTTLDKALGKCK